jgi:hypothetical protein
LKPNDVKSCNPFPVDVFAFGVTLMLLMNPDADCQQLTDCDWSQVPNTPPAVLQLGRRCTQRDPLQRPTMQEVHDELQRVVAALAELQSFLECAGVVPAGDCAAFARGLSVQGVDGAATLQRVVQENTGLCSAVGMSLDQQGCLTQYVNRQIAAAAAAAARIQNTGTPATVSTSVKVWTAQSHWRQEFCERANKFPFTFCRLMMRKSLLLLLLPPTPLRHVSLRALLSHCAFHAHPSPCRSVSQLFCRLLLLPASQAKATFLRRRRTATCSWCGIMSLQTQRPFVNGTKSTTATPIHSFEHVFVICDLF